MRRSLKIALAVVFLLLVISVFVPDMISAPVDLVLTVLFGWVAFLFRTIPQLQWDFSTLAIAVISLALVALLGHLFCRWLYGQMTRVDASDSSLAKRWRPHWTMAAILLIVVMFSAGIAVAGIAHQTMWLARSPGPWFATRGREQANRVKCSANMKMIALAIQQYAADHDGWFPDTLATLVRQGELTSSMFICPSSNDNASDAADINEIARQIDEDARTCSYVYLGEGMRLTSPASTPVLVDRESNHNFQVVNVMFADGQIRNVTLEKFRAGNFDEVVQRR
jgi:hypothetical protein